MALTSSSSVTDALAQYNDNLSWEGDATKAAAALEAVRFLLVNRPQSVQREGVRLDYTLLEKELGRLEAFVNLAGSTSAARRACFVRAKARML
jgi:hypothetical protein